MRLLLLINPNASRALDALEDIEAWFAGRADVTTVVTHKKKDIKRALKAEGQAADRIVMGGGDGTLSKALPALLKLNKPVGVLPLGTAATWGSPTARPISMSPAWAWPPRSSRRSLKT